MKKCIYCKKTEGGTTFRGKEHVIPKLMGVFDNNPTIRGRVCDICNSTIFNALETKFKEDTEEGIFYQMFNFEKSFQIRIRGKNINTTFSSGLGDKFFDEIFPFFKRQDDDWKIFILPQIKIKRYGEKGYLILLVDELKKASPGKVRDIKKLLTGVQSKDVQIFAGGNHEGDDLQLNDAIKLLKELGIDYKEGARKFAPLSVKPNEKQFKVSMDCVIGNDVGRIIAKIAFNYFIYCALENGRDDVAFHPNFDRIKAYIIGDQDLPIKEVVAMVENAPITYEEASTRKRFIGHILTFTEEKGMLVSRISFLGKRAYTVILGKMPEDLQKQEFGCGHLFDPVQKKFFGLTQNQSKWGSGQEPGFGLFCRV